MLKVYKRCLPFCEHPFISLSSCSHRDHKVCSEGHTEGGRHILFLVLVGTSGGIFSSIMLTIGLSLFSCVPSHSLLLAIPVSKLALTFSSVGRMLTVISGKTGGVKAPLTSSCGFLKPMCQNDACGNYMFMRRN